MSKADDAPEERARVFSRIAPFILQFKAERPSSTFHAEELRDYVIERLPDIAPDSPGRILRELRLLKWLNYVVINRRQSLYQFRTRPIAPRAPMHTKANLRAYQNRGVTALYESDGLALIFPMGSGKTITALTAAQELIESARTHRHALILAPKRVATLVWPQELADWEHTRSLLYEVLDGDPEARSRDLATIADRDLTIIGVDNTQWLCDELSKLPDGHPIFDLLIIDELSRFKDPKSKRAKALLKQVKRFRTIWGLTGTPRPNGTEDLFKPLSIVTKEALWGRSFYAWQKERFFPADRNGYKWTMFPQWEERTAAEAATVMLALSPEDMPELPEVNVIEHHVTLPADVYEQYEEMQKKLLAEVEGREILAASAGVASGKLAQMANGFLYGEGGNEDVTELHREKADWIADLVEDLAGDPLIVVYEYIEDLRTLRTLFGKDLPTIGHGTTDGQAAANIALWNAGKLPIMAMHAASGGHGLNLQFGGSQIAWYGLTWSAELYDQTIARIVRPGQKKRCFVHLCLARDTVDELKRFRVVMKMSAQDAFKAWLKTI